MSEAKDRRDTAETRKTPATPFHPDLVWREQLTGARPGDRVVRVARHRHFRGVRPGILLPRPEAMEPRGGLGRLWWRLRHLLIGSPLPTAVEVEERLTKVKALAVLSSDALSSVATATEAAMRVLILAGVGALALTLPLSVAVVLLLIIVATSYQQTIQAYPSGGGSYVVAHENLGVIPGLVAAAALSIGYVLTVAVSIAAGTAAITSAFPELKPYDVWMAVAAVALITVLNLRGVRESGTIFAVPTYLFIVSILGLILLGIFRQATGGIPYQPVDPGPHAGTEPLTWFLILSAFARGASAMTGTEAIANSVPAFKRPEAKNAVVTLRWMAVLLAVMFLGISFLASQIRVVPDPTETETVLSQLTRLIVGDNWYYYLVQAATAMILLLAANTSYTGFPWLLGVMARDRYVPRWFGFRGERLVFSVGIMALAILSILLLAAFGSSVERLLPMYAIGVFAAFTLSQAGMVVHWLRGRESNRGRKAGINGLGAVATAVATVVFGITRFTEGAWMVMIVVPILVVLFLQIHHHYLLLARELRTESPVKPKGKPPLAVVPISSLSMVARRALAFAQDISPRVVAVHVTADLAEAERLRADWQRVVGDLPLVIIESPYRQLLPPLLAYVDALRETHPEDTLLVVLPEFVPRHWWDNLLHTQTALRLKAALLFRPDVVVASYPSQVV